MITIWYFHQVNYFLLEKNTLEIITLSCLTSKIWGFKFEFRPSKVNSGQNYFCCSKAHIIISYSIFDFNVSRGWHLTSKSHLGLKKSYTIRKPIYEFLFDFYGHHLSILYHIRVFRIQNFWVWLWPLTSERLSGSRKIILFVSPYMTSYLTSMDTISLSRTVFDIFDFKVLKVWPWPLNSEGHLVSSVKKIYTIRKHIYDFLFDFYWQHICISYRFREIRIQSSHGLSLTFDHWKSSGV